MKPWKVPTDVNGGVIRYVNSPRAVHKWVDADTTWNLELVLRDCYHGNSASWFVFHNARNPKQLFPFAASRLMEMLKAASVVEGRVLGEFGVWKRGSIFSMVYLGKGEWDAKV